MAVVAKPSRATLEEQEALEFGMKPFLDTLNMEQADAVRTIYRYSFAYREGARRLGITTAALQRRIKSSVKAMRKVLESSITSSGFVLPAPSVIFPEQSEDGRAFLTKAAANPGTNTGYREGPRKETTMDMTVGRLGKFDPGSAVPRRALTEAERAWLASGRHEEGDEAA
jgi:predicted DNA-binding protein (UPF0251 family)